MDTWTCKLDTCKYLWFHMLKFLYKGWWDDPPCSLSTPDATIYSGNVSYSIQKCSKNVYCIRHCTALSPSSRQKAVSQCSGGHLLFFSIIWFCNYVISLLPWALMQLDHQLQFFILDVPFTNVYLGQVLTNLGHVWFHPTKI
jgi:hypothetical protein